MGEDVLAVLGARLRAARLTKGWSQERLAEEAGLHRTYVGAIERGERNITLSSLSKLASALEIAAHNLIAPSPQP